MLHYNTEKCAIKTDKNIQSRYNQIQYKIRKYYSHKEKDNIYIELIKIVQIIIKF